MSAPAAFYDAILGDPRNAYGLPLEQSPYRELYHKVARLIAPGQRIVDLGCGSGRFASLVIPEAASYVGIDFSRELLLAAAMYNDVLIPGRFRQADLRTCAIPDADVYVLLEVLEHLDDDLALLARLPKGSTLVASVPSFDSASHMQVFPSEANVWSRYGGQVTIEGDIERIDLPRKGACFWLFKGRL